MTTEIIEYTETERALTLLHKQYRGGVKRLARADLEDQRDIANRDHRLRLMIAVDDAMKKTSSGFKLTVHTGNQRPLPPTDS